MGVYVPAMSTCAALPFLLFTLLAGVIADLVDRRMPKEDLATALSLSGVRMNVCGIRRAAAGARFVVGGARVIFF